MSNLTDRQILAGITAANFELCKQAYNTTGTSVEDVTRRQNAAAVQAFRAAASDVPDDFTERQRKVIRFALWHFSAGARARADAAAQDKEGLEFPPGAVDAFLRDAQDAEAILTILRADAAARL